MSAATPVAAANDRLLQEACARNTPVEFHYEETSGGRIIVGRSRILAFDDDAILADAPTYPDGDGSIPVDETDDVLLGRSLGAAPAPVSAAATSHRPRQASVSKKTADLLNGLILIALPSA